MAQVINPFPFGQDLKEYRLPSFRRDLIAAISVALLALPQAMAYAFVAGLPISAGVWSAVFGTIFTAAFGQSRFLISGPSNAIAILIQSGTSEILYTYFRGVSGVERDLLALKIILLVSLIIGVFQITGGILRLGRLTQFASRSVTIGYMAGAAFVIFVRQLYPFFGVKGLNGYQPLYQEAFYFFSRLPTLHLWTTLIAIGSLALIIFFYRISPKIPGAVIVFVLAGGCVALFNLSPEGAEKRVMLLEDIGPLYSDLPHFAFPSFDIYTLTKVFPLAFAIAILSILMATAIGRSYTTAKEPVYDDNQEIFGLGISNLLSSFLGAMPSSGSLSRTALNYSSGAKTRFSAIFSGIFVFVFVLSIGFLITRIPLAALSALMLFTAYTMVNFQHLLICLKATRYDAFVVAITFLSTLFFTLDVALYVGIILSIVLYLKQAAVPLLVEYGFNNVGKLRPLEPDDERPDPRICIIQAEGELFFGAADLLQTKLRAISEDESLRIVILQLLNTRNMDASVCLALEQVLKYLKFTKRYLILSGVTPEVWRVLQISGLLEQIGEEQCFPVNEQLPSEPTRNAYSLAKSIVSSS